MLARLLARDINDFIECLDFIKNHYVYVEEIREEVVVRIFWEIGSRTLSSTLNFSPEGNNMDHVKEVLVKVINETNKAFVEGRVYGKL